MELSFETRPVRYLGHLLHETGRQEETAEVIVPDSCPDVERVVFASASALLRGVECRTGSALISGGIRASALCIPENDTAPQKLDAYLPFSLRMEHSAITDRTQLLPELFVRQADARLVNSRKILFRVELCCTLDGYEQKELTIYTLQNPPQQLQLRTQTYPVLLPTETAEKSFTLSDEPELPSGRAMPAEIISYETRPEVTDCKVVGSKAVFKGSLCLHVLYRNTEGALAVWDRQLPFSQFCDLTGDYEQAQMDAQVVVNSAELELDASDAHRFLLSVGMTARCVVSDMLSLTLTEDAYAVGASLQPEWTQYALECQLDRQTLRDAVRQQIGGEIASVVDTAVYLDAPYLERDGGAMRVKAPMTLRVLYQDASGALQGTAVKSEAAVETALCENARCFASAFACESSVQAAPDGAEARTEVTFRLSCSAAQQLRTLSGGTLEICKERDPERPSVILRAPRGRESVWELAKQYGTTVQSVTEANHLDSELVEEGQILLIPM